MNINRTEQLKSFKRNTYNDINVYGIGPIITEHIPDNLFHGKHKTAILGKISDTSFYFGYENPITDDQFSKLNIKSCEDDSHNNIKCLATNGDGLKPLLVGASSITFYNIKYCKDELFEREIKMKDFFRVLNNNDGSNFEYKLMNNINSSKYPKNKWNRSRLDEFLNTDIGKKTLEILPGNKPFPFGYFIEYDKTIDEDDDKDNFLKQEEIVNKFTEFLKNDCKEIQIKNSYSKYDLYKIFENSITKIPNYDPTNYDERKGCLGVYFNILGEKTNQMAEFFVIGDKKHRKYTRNITSGSNPKSSQICKITTIADYSGKIEIYFLDPQKYNSNKHKGHHGGWIYLIENNNRKILVNLEPINTDLFKKGLNDHGHTFIKSLRIKITLNRSDLFKNDGRKHLATLKNNLNKLIKHLIEKIWMKASFYSNDPKQRPWRGDESSYNETNITNITELLDTQKDNLERKSQSKKNNPPICKNIVMGANKKIITSKKNLNTQKVSSNPIKSELSSQEQNTGFLYAVTWDYLETIAEQHGLPGLYKCGWTCDQTSLVKRYQKYSFKRIKLIILEKDVHNVRRTETHLWFIQDIMKNSNFKTLSKGFNEEYIVDGIEYFALPIDIIKKRAKIAKESMKQNLVN